jgi:hypothetical protein
MSGECLENQIRTQLLDARSPDARELFGDLMGQRVA